MKKKNKANGFITNKTVPVEIPQVNGKEREDVFINPTVQSKLIGEGLSI